MESKMNAYKVTTPNTASRVVLASSFGEAEEIVVKFFRERKIEANVYCIEKLNALSPLLCKDCDLPTPSEGNNNLSDKA